MKKSKKNTEINLKTKKEVKTKKQYQKPHIVNTKVIETLAGSCNAQVTCQPNL